MRDEALLAMSSRVKCLTESQALAILRTELGESYRETSSGLVRRGIGDDCAVVTAPQGVQVWTIDSCNEGSHFLWDWMAPEDIAHKSFQAALSDIPAMGARPLAALCQLTLSPRVSAPWLRRFAREQARISLDTKTPLVGGNICFGGRLQVSTTVLGQHKGKVLQRDGAQEKDEVWLVGSVGLARAGLLLLEAGIHKKKKVTAAQRRCLSAFRRPVALTKEGQELVGRAHSCMDVSDGLLRDAPRLAEASGLRIEIDARLLRGSLCSDLELVAVELGTTGLALALEGGEDYALLVTGPRERRPAFAQVIGRVVTGAGASFPAM